MMQDLLAKAGPGRHWVLFTSNHDDEGPFIGAVGPLLGEKGLDATFTLRPCIRPGSTVDLTPAPEARRGGRAGPLRQRQAQQHFELRPA